MEIAKITVDTVTARVERCRPIPRGLVGGRVAISFRDPAWNKLNKTAVFRGAVTRDVLVVSDSVEIPWETVSKAGKKLYIGIYGRDAAGEMVIPTVWTPLGTIEGAADPSGDISVAPSPEVWEQMQAMIGSLDNLETEAKDTVVDAINETLGKCDVSRDEVKPVVLECLEAVGTGADVYVLADGENLADAPEKADVVIDPNGPETVSADWKAKEGEPGFVANRTHWTEGETVHKLDNKYLDLDWLPTKKTNEVPIAAEKTVTNDVNHGFPDLTYAMVTEGQILIVYYDGGRYEVTVSLRVEDDGSRYALAMGENTPFLLLYIIGTKTIVGTGDDEEHIASVWTYETEYNKIPAGYLPEDFCAIDAEAVAEAVGNYLAENPVAETDPTVPAWAKAETKPTYTAEEVGALPEDTPIPAVPEKLPNPHALTFTGAVEATYDGSEAVSVEIPSGGGSKEWTLLAAVTFDGATSTVAVTENKDGSPLWYDEFYYFSPSITTGSNYVSTKFNKGSSAVKVWYSVAAKPIKQHIMPMGDEYMVGLSFGDNAIKGNHAFSKTLLGNNKKIEYVEVWFTTTPVEGETLYIYAR